MNSSRVATTTTMKTNWRFNVNNGVKCATRKTEKLKKKKKFYKRKKKFVQ